MQPLLYLVLPLVSWQVLKLETGNDQQDSKRIINKVNYNIKQRERERDYLTVINSIPPGLLPKLYLSSMEVKFNSSTIKHKWPSSKGPSTDTVWLDNEASCMITWHSCDYQTDTPTFIPSSHFSSMSRSFCIPSTETWLTWAWLINLLIN